jgi:hypothetical protein
LTGGFDDVLLLEERLLLVGSEMANEAPHLVMIAHEENIQRSWVGTE